MKKKSDIKRILSVCGVLTAFIFSLIIFQEHGNATHLSSGHTLLSQQVIMQLLSPSGADYEKLKSEYEHSQPGLLSLEAIDLIAQVGSETSCNNLVYLHQPATSDTGIRTVQKSKADISIDRAPYQQDLAKKGRFIPTANRSPGDVFAWNAYSGTSGLINGPVTLSLIDCEISNLKEVIPTAIWMSGGDFVNETWYTVSHSGINVSGLYSVDISNGDYTLLFPYPNLALTGLAYDITGKIMYASGWDGSNSWLHTINLITGSVFTFPDPISNYEVIGLACDIDGNLFGITLNNNSLYSIDNTSGIGDLIGPLGLTLNYAQDIGYDRDNCILYGSLYYFNGSSYTGGLFEISTVTGAATFICDVIAEICALSIPYHCDPGYCNHEIVLSHPIPDNNGDFVVVDEICSGDPVHFRIVNSKGQSLANSSATTTINWSYSDNNGIDWLDITPTGPSALFSGFAFVSPPGHGALSFNLCEGQDPGYVDRIYRAEITVTDGAHTCEYIAESPELRICCPVNTLSITMFPEADEVLCEGDLVQFEVTVVSNLPDPNPGNNSVEIKWKVIINDQEILLDDPNYTNKASITYPYDIPMTVTGGTICFIAEVSNCSCPTWYIHECINIDPQPVCGIITEDHVNLYPDPNGDPDLFYICPHNDAAIKIHPNYPFADCRIQWQFSFTNYPGSWINLGAGNTSQNTNVLPQLKSAGSPYLWPPLQKEIFYRIKCLPLSDPSGCEPCYSNVLTIKLLEPPDPPVITGSSDPMCDGNSTPLAIEDYFADNTYEWFLNGFSVGFGSPFNASQGGLYIVSVTDQYGCHTVDSDPFYLQVCTVVASICCPTPPCPCIGDPITLSAGTSYSTCGGGLTYAWSWDSGTLIANNGATIVHIPDPGGTTYTVIVSDALGCSGTAVRTVVPCECEPVPSDCPPTVTDIDGNIYNTVQIGEQCWMKENLKTTHDAAGNNISRSCYDNNTTYCEIYGGLYSWATVMNGAGSSNSNPSGVQGICPTDWHLPSDAEWTQLLDYVVVKGFPNTMVTNGAANALKSCRQVNSPLGGDCNTSVHPRWDSHSIHHGFDEFGFSALPGGNRFANVSFIYLGDIGDWLSSTEQSSSAVWLWRMISRYGSVGRINGDKSGGFSVRCIRD